MIDTAEIQAVIRGFNPWWMNKPLDIPEFRRLGFFACRRLLHTPGLKRAILLSGPRRVGKTTILEQLAASLLQDDQALPASILYLSLDHPLLKLMSLARILKMYHETVHPAGQPTTLLLDEIQYAGDWDLELKQLVDHHPEYRIIATGSATVLHKDKLSESGVGRWITVPIPTLNFYEFIQIRNESPDLGNAVLLRSEEILSDADQIGKIVETTVLRHLYAYYYRDTPRIGYWRDNKTDREVDIIVRSPAYVLPVEVKYRSRADIPTNCGMATFCAAEPVKQAFWITQRPEDFEVQKVPGCDTQILRIPGYIFCYLLGQAERSLWDGVE